MLGRAPVVGFSSTCIYRICPFPFAVLDVIVSASASFSFLLRLLLLACLRLVGGENPESDGLRARAAVGACTKQACRCTFMEGILWNERQAMVVRHREFGR